jgi:hypothetical protein
VHLRSTILTRVSGTAAGDVLGNGVRRIKDCAMCLRAAGCCTGERQLGSVLLGSSQCIFSPESLDYGNPEKKPVQPEWS